MIQNIDAAAFQRMVVHGAAAINAQKQAINDLNVFPVPDGDTGTNMSLTIGAAVPDMQNKRYDSVGQAAQGTASALLRGARGNSGVILSLLFRGFAKAIKEKEIMDGRDLAIALDFGVAAAYKAVMKPAEGTILTVSRLAAARAAGCARENDNLEAVLEAAIEEGHKALDNTINQNPVLKKAGVVDAGGKGFLVILQGMLDELRGLPMPELTAEEEKAPADKAEFGVFSTEEIKFGYCTEFIVNVEKTYDMDEEQKFKGYLESIGDCVVVVSDDDIIKVHVHTNHPGLAFEKGLTYGSLSRMKIDNMREEHHERLIQNASNVAQTPETPAEAKKEEAPASNEPRKPYGFIAVSIGKGLGEIFKGIGADYLIEGGQTMNPSTEDMLNAIDKVSADNIFILPNNKNIILAAQQASSLVEDKNIIVIPSKTVPQGITALVNFMPDLSVTENVDNMEREMGSVKTAQITYAVRTTNIDGMDIEQGDIMGLGDHGMLAVGKSVEGTAMAALKAMIDENSELVTIYYGSDIGGEDAERMADQARAEFPEAEIELQYGGQPIYYYLISVE